MTAGYRDFRPRDEDPNDHASVAAMRARSEAVKVDEAFRQAMLAAIAAGQECGLAAQRFRKLFVASNEGFEWAVSSASLPLRDSQLSYRQRRVSWRLSDIARPMLMASRFSIAKRDQPTHRNCFCCTAFRAQATCFVT